MRSYISSFSDRPNSGRWGRTLIFAGFLYVLGLAGWETYAANFVPHFSVENSYGRWAEKRGLASEQGECAVILAGASRLQLGIDIDAMAAWSPREPLQTAIYASNYLRSLEELAADETIIGTVIVSIGPQHLTNLADLSTAANWLSRYSDVQHGRDQAFYDQFEERLSLFLDQRLLYRQDGARPVDVLRDFNINRYTYMDSRRRVYADFSLVDETQLYEKKMAEYIGSDPGPAPRDHFPSIVQRTVSAIEKIQVRDGKVILLRLPSSRGVLAGESIIYPRGELWDKLVAQTSAQAIHFADYPQLSQYHLPDGAHLDYRDATAFTHDLSRVLFADESWQTLRRSCRADL